MTVGGPVQVSEWMKHRVRVVEPGDSVRRARALLEEHRINQLPVVFEGQLVGIVTDRDLRDAFPSVLDHRRQRPAKSNPGPDEISVESVMTTNVITARPDDPIVEVARLMRSGRIGAIPVVENHRLLGLITRSDILDAFVALVASHQTPRPAEGARHVTA